VYRALTKERLALVRVMRVYVAQSRWQGQRRINSFDIFHFGVLLYEMLTRQLP